MPALTQRILRRKRALPAAIISGEQSGWPWVEDNSSSIKRNNSNINKSASNSDTAAMASQLQVVNGEPANDVEPPKTWFDLPEEIQSHIIKDVSISNFIIMSEVEAAKSHIAVFHTLPSSPVGEVQASSGPSLHCGSLPEHHGPISKVNRGKLTTL